MNIKGKSGITSIDLTIAMIVIMIFAVIMSSISYNVYSSSIEAKRTAIALNYAVDIFERIGYLDYSDVVASYDLIDFTALKDFEYEEVTSGNGNDTIKGKVGTYDIELNIDDYKDGGIVKTITLSIEYNVSRKNKEKIELKRLKTINV